MSLNLIQKGFQGLSTKKSLIVEFDLGFLDLPTLLRTRSSAAAAELDFTRQQLRVARARARLNQAQGVLP